MCCDTGATSYLTGSAARSYLNESFFVEAGVKVCWMDYSDYLEYPQLYPPFDHAVTILDLIFNCGPASSKYMKGFLK